MSLPPPILRNNDGDDDVARLTPLPVLRASASAAAAAAPAPRAISAPPPPSPPSSSTQPWGRSVGGEGFPAVAVAASPPMPPPTPCRFYLAGMCRYGSSCRFSHDLPGGYLTVDEARSKTPCAFYLGGFCKYGDSCAFRHDAGEGHEVTSGDTGMASTVELDARKAPAAVSSQGSTMAEIGKREPPPPADEEDDENTCGICFEDVVSMEGGQFGLLSCCDHRFCLNCLRQWRKTRLSADDTNNSVRFLCPTCRKRSDYVVPSRVFYRGAQRDAAVKRYMEYCSQIPCKHFTGRIGSCHFGKQCHFAHLDGGTSGRDIKDQDEDPAVLARRRNQRREERLLLQMGMGGQRGRRRGRGRDESFGMAIPDPDVVEDAEEAIVSFLALLNFYGYGLMEDSDSSDNGSNWGGRQTQEEID